MATPNQMCEDSFGNAQVGSTSNKNEIHFIKTVTQSFSKFFTNVN